MTINEAKGIAQYLTFSVGEEEYGVSILAVREILEYGVVTRVPRAPSHIRGVMNLRGRVVPLVDLAVRFGLPPAPPTARTCVVVVEVELQGERTVMGLVVDAVSQVIELGTEDIEAAPPFGATVDAAFLTGMGRAGKRFVLLVDVQRVLAALPDAPLTVPAADDERHRTSSAGLAATAALVLFSLLGLAPSVSAQEPIKDNSFLIEEAYNQPRGVVQHINALSRSSSGGDWIYTFTQEWPAPSIRHQVSFTLPVMSLHTDAFTRTGVGDLAFNYRYQAVGTEGGPVAFAPRLSILAPTGSYANGLGSGGVGVQANLPLSVEHGSRFVTHWNVGITRTQRARAESGEHANINAYNLGQSIVWLAGPKVNLLVETSWTRAQAVIGEDRTENKDVFLVSPGIRWAHDFKNGLQIVPGLAVPIGVGPSSGERGVFVYLSLEHAFRRSR
jgi:chemotaxis signal transduction protein